MTAITNEMIHVTYDLAKKVYSGKISQKNGLDELVTKYQMNRNSAADYSLLFGLATAASPPECNPLMIQ